MKIAIGADHRGFSPKQELARHLAAAGHDVFDCGCDGPQAADYPDAAFICASRVARHESDVGILICGSGIGMSIAANKVAGVRASLCHDDEAARATREHNDSNILCLSGDRLSVQDAIRLAGVYLAAQFTGGRHARRIAKIVAYEAEHIK